MPVVIQGADERKDISRLKDYEYNYTYPLDIDLRPGSKLHEKIRSEVLNRARESHHVMQSRYEEWGAIDRTLESFVELTTEEEKVKDEDDRKPVSVVVPISYAILDTMLSYLVAAFLEDPYFRYEGIGPEDALGAILMEKVVSAHCSKLRVGLQLYTMCRDFLVYGFGVASPIWYKKMGMRVIKPSGVTNVFRKFIGSEPTGSSEREIMYEGNKLVNIDPYTYLPDPNVPIHDVQSGEFTGWVDSDNLMSLLEEEAINNQVFNVRYLKHISGRSSIIKLSDDDSGRSDRWGSPKPSEQSTNPVDVIWQYVNLIPEDWGLGDSSYPEKWFFGLAADEIVVRAQPLGLNHNMYPVCVGAPNFDGYSVTPVSVMETIHGLQETIDWELSSRIANVRKSQNDMFVVDPMLVNIHDLKRPGPGKLIRMRRSAWGSGKVQDAVQQLNVHDTTQGHVADVGNIIDIIQRVTGASDSLQGIMRHTSERKTATEARGARSGALSRIEKGARVASMQAFQDIGFMFAMHTQQFMTDDMFVKVTGEWEQKLRDEYDIQGDRVKVRPKDINVMFDVLVRDGSIPSGEYASVWIQLLQLIPNIPEIANDVDGKRLFAHIARLLGAKNVEDFWKKGSKTNAEAQSGNIDIDSLTKPGEIIGT